jgi:hypothetical protein
LAGRELSRRLRRLEAAVPQHRPQAASLANTNEGIDAHLAEVLRGLPDPDSAAWRPEHHGVLAKVAALHRRRWTPNTNSHLGHDLMANPDMVVQVARILREAGME